MSIRILRRAFMAGLAAVAAAACAHTAKTADAKPAQPDIGLYELRIYTAAEGKMDALNTRFRDHTVSLFRKHGMTPIGFWTVQPPAGKPVDDRLIYLMGYKDKASRDAAWKAFGSDPEWTKVYQASQANGSLTSKIENVFYTPAEYSMKFELAPAASPRFFELRTYTATPGKLENVHARFRDHTIGIFKRLGFTSMVYMRPTPDQPAMADKMTYLLAFPSLDARNAAWKAFSADPEWQKVSADSQKDGPILIPGGVASTFLVPTDYSPVK